MKNSNSSSTNYKIQLLKNENTVWEWGAAKRKFIFWICGAAVILLGVFYCIFAFTPLKTIMPGYPSEADRAKNIRTLRKLDSLDKEINLWKQQLKNIQLITSGQEPVAIKSDSAYIALIDAANAELWGESEKMLREEVEKSKE